MKESSNERKSKSNNTKRELVSITDGSKIIWIRKDCAEEYISKGFKYGLKPNNQKDESRRWVNKDGKSFLVKKEYLNNYLRTGYSLGRAKVSKTNSTDTKDSSKELEKN